MTIDPTSFNLPKAKFLSADDLDSVARALLSLTMELAVTNDRLIALEDYVATKGGVDALAQIAQHEPGQAARDAMVAQREKLIATIIGTLAQDDGPD